MAVPNVVTSCQDHLRRLCRGWISRGWRSVVGKPKTIMTFDRNSSGCRDLNPGPLDPQTVLGRLVHFGISTLCQVG